MKTALFLVALLAFSACEGPGPSDETTAQAAGGGVTITGPSCVTCKALDVGSCDLCSVCKSAALMSRGFVITESTGCLPTGTWCGDRAAPTCRTVVCATDCP